MNKEALIVGSSVSGIQAAMDLADVGIKVHLVESMPFMGNVGEAVIPRHILNTRMLEVARHPNVRIWTNTYINRAQGEAGCFDIELRQHPRYVDLSRCTACGECEAVCPVTAPGCSHKVIYLGGQPECMAIEKSGKSPCANTCPGGIHVQGYVALIAQGRFQEAIDLVRESIPFPAICGRVCTHPCEVNCRRAEIDKPVAIRLLKRFLSDWESEQGRQAGLHKGKSEAQHPVHNPKRVAIVGAGPGGMAVADRLARIGYQVTVFEKLPVIGGMMAIGIPQYRLPRDIIQREYQHILDLGVELRLNTSIGPGGDYTIDNLFDSGYEAICLAIGAHKSQNLHLPGEDLNGVMHGIELLKTINLSQHQEKGNTGSPGKGIYLQRLLPKGVRTRVGILGGGNTAMDVSRCLRRLGVKDVRILYRRTRKEMPAMPEEIEDAELEGVSIEYLLSPVRILGNEKGDVTGLECIRMKLGEPDSSGRRRPVPISGSEFVVELDLVILAVGQTPDMSCLEGRQEIAITRDERINVTDVSFMTSRNGVFAVGDAITNDKMVVIEAIGMGKKAAIAIDAFLCNKQVDEIVVDSREEPIARREMRQEELIPISRVQSPTISMERRLSSFDEVELGYTAEQAMAEAQRCLVCGPCSECMACIEVCKPGAINHEQREILSHLEIGAILVTDNLVNLSNFPSVEGKGVYHVPPDDALSGSAAAANVMVDFGFNYAGPLPSHLASVLVEKDKNVRIGVFICECGGEISRIVDIKTAMDSLADLPGIVYSRVLPFSCSPGAAQEIQNDVDTHKLNHVVLAGCSCCSIDQVCLSCTFQRIRCKQNLGIFAYPGIPSREAYRDIKYGLVNIREQCAWVHKNDPQAATVKAIALIKAAVFRVQSIPHRLIGPQPVDKSVLILGSGLAAGTCWRALSNQGIAVQKVDIFPDQIRRMGGKYLVLQNSATWQASGMVIAPENDEEGWIFWSAFGEEKYRPRVHDMWGGLDTHRPGVFICPPTMNPEKSGLAAAIRIIAWLNRMENRPPVASFVNPDRCRACGTCVGICEFGAPVLVEENAHRNSWIDPMICTGCGTCVARCPSGAITAGFSSDAQLEAMLEAILANCDNKPREGLNGKS